jgi:hypothetical protein
MHRGHSGDVPPRLMALEFRLVPGDYDVIDATSDLTTMTQGSTRQCLNDHVLQKISFRRLVS